MQIQGHTFFITGGSSGLGLACARHIIDGGGNVVLADVDSPAGAQRAAELGSRARFVETDVVSDESVRHALALLAEQFGPVHGVVNCAGVLGAARVVGRDGPHDLAMFARIVRINLIGTFNVVRLAAAAMAANEPDAEGERGVIVNTSSVAAFDGQIGQAAYAASKGGVAAMTLPLARDLARLGIRVVAIAPGVFETPMVAALSEEARQSLTAQALFPPRLGKPGEFAALVEHVVSNVMLNGTVIRLDGALRMAAK